MFETIHHSYPLSVKTTIPLKKQEKKRKKKKEAKKEEEQNKEKMILIDEERIKERTKENST